ncbi:MAG TPA: hypothetical protein VFA18_02275 [Gemmataceae bacterium]|nr:hypothetical protein [Gemmataceae bacterium]
MFARICLIAPALLLVFGLAASADEIRGVISKVDAGHHQLIVSGRGRMARGKDFTFRLASETKITLGKNPAKEKELQAGQRVRVQFETRDGQNVAVQVSAMQRGAALRAGMEKADGILRLLDLLMKQREGTPPSQ